MSRAFYCAAVFALCLIVGCATAGPDAMPREQTSLQGTLLSVPLAKKGPHISYKNQQFALFRLVSPTQSPDANWGIARLQLEKYKEISIAVERRSVAQTVAENGWAHFSLPPDLNAGADCFVMVNWGSWVTPRAGESTLEGQHLISLKAFGARKVLFDAKRGPDAVQETRRLAEQRLVANRAFRNSSCAMPEFALPARPKGAMTYEEALPLAEALVIDSMSDRLGCDATAELLGRAGLISSWRRFATRFTCGRTGLHDLVPKTDLTPLVDYLESRLLSCAAEDKLGCLIAYVLVISQRFSIDRERVASRLSASHRQWEADVATIQRSAAHAYDECTTDISTVENWPAVRGASERALAQAEETWKRIPTADGSYHGDTLRCERTIGDYVSHRGSARYVGVH